MMESPLPRPVERPIATLGWEITHENIAQEVRTFNQWCTSHEAGFMWDINSWHFLVGRLEEFAKYARYLLLPLTRGLRFGTKDADPSPPESSTWLDQLLSIVEWLLDQADKDEKMEFRTTLRKVYKDLRSMSLHIVQQPTPVIKYPQDMRVSLALLLRNSDHEDPNSLKLSYAFINDEEFQELFADEQGQTWDANEGIWRSRRGVYIRRSEFSGGFVHCQQGNIIYFQQPTGRNNLRLLKFIRSGERDSVAHKLWTLVFAVELQTRVGPITVFSCTRPTVVISHSDYNIVAEATLCWSQFQAGCRNPLKLPETIPWALNNGTPSEFARSMSQQLEKYFKETVGTERTLSDNDLECLRNQLITLGIMRPNTNDVLASEFLPVRESHAAQGANNEAGDPRFQFWIWFYKSVILLKNELKNEWESGAIYGFATMDNAEFGMLVNFPPVLAGDFVLRMSMREPAITFAVLIQQNGGDASEIHSYGPYRREEFLLLSGQLNNPYLTRVYNVLSNSFVPKRPILSNILDMSDPVTDARTRRRYRNILEFASPAPGLPPQ